MKGTVRTGPGASAAKPGRTNQAPRDQSHAQPRGRRACGRARRAWRGPTLSSPAAARPGIRTIRGGNAGPGVRAPAEARRDRTLVVEGAAGRILRRACRLQRPARRLHSSARSPDLPAIQDNMIAALVRVAGNGLAVIKDRRADFHLTMLRLTLNETAPSTPAAPTLLSARSLCAAVLPAAWPPRSALHHARQRERRESTQGGTRRGLGSVRSPCRLADDICLALLVAAAASVSALRETQERMKDFEASPRPAASTARLPGWRPSAEANGRGPQGSRRSCAFARRIRQGPSRECAETRSGSVSGASRARSRRAAGARSRPAGPFRRCCLGPRCRKRVDPLRLCSRVERRCWRRSERGRSSGKGCVVHSDATRLR